MLRLSRVWWQKLGLEHCWSKIGNPWKSSFKTGAFLDGHGCRSAGAGLGQCLGATLVFRLSFGHRFGSYRTGFMSLISMAGEALKVFGKTSRDSDANSVVDMSFFEGGLAKMLHFELPIWTFERSLAEKSSWTCSLEREKKSSMKTKNAMSSFFIVSYFSVMRKVFQVNRCWQVALAWDHTKGSPRHVRSSVFADGELARWSCRNHPRWATELIFHLILVAAKIERITPKVANVTILHQNLMIQ